MSKQVLVLGAGVVGLCTALHAARRGHRVTVMEQHGAQRDGCSFGNAGMIVPSHFTPLAAPGMVALGLKWMWNPESPFWIKPGLDPDLLRWCWQFWRAATPEHVRRSAPLLRDLSLRSRALFEELAAECGNEFGLTRRGLLMLCKTEHTLEEEAQAAAQARTLGLSAEVLDARQTAALDPGIAMDVAGAVHFPQDCHLTPGRLIATLERLCLAAGVTFEWGRKVQGFRSTSSTLSAVETDAGPLEAEEFALCLGAWSTGMAAPLGLRLPMQAGKGYSLTVPQPRELPQLCSILTEARVAVTPMGAALRFGGTMEIAGLHERINARRVQGIIRAAQLYFPGVSAADFEGVVPWCGLRPCSPDGLPYVGRTARWRNLSVATGHAMMGLSLGPVTGEIMARLLSGETLDASLSALSPDRYA